MLKVFGITVKRQESIENCFKIKHRIVKNLRQRYRMREIMLLARISQPALLLGQSWNHSGKPVPGR
jgi:hypothetical protein